MGRAGRWQAGEAQAALAQIKPHIAIERGFGLCAIEEHLLYAWMRIEKRTEIIWHDRVLFDVRIQAAFARARSQHIPYGKPGTAQNCNPPCVGDLGSCAKQHS